MPRRINPAREAELFDDGSVDDLIADQPEQGTAAETSHDESGHQVSAANGSGPQESGASEPGDSAGVTHSGRVRHDGKITVYLSRDELDTLSATRLALRADFGVAADRGHIVRAAVALAVEDLAANGADSALVARLRQS